MKSVWIARASSTSTHQRLSCLELRLSPLLPHSLVGRISLGFARGQDSFDVEAASCEVLERSREDRHEEECVVGALLREEKLAEAGSDLSNET